MLQLRSSLDFSGVFEVGGAGVRGGLHSAKVLINYKSITLTCAAKVPLIYPFYLTKHCRLLIVLPVGMEPGLRRLLTRGIIGADQIAWPERRTLKGPEGCASLISSLEAAEFLADCAWRLSDVHRGSPIYSRTGPMGAPVQYHKINGQRKRPIPLFGCFSGDTGNPAMNMH